MRAPCIIFRRARHKAWVDLSCAALPEHLLESELFGYDKGAFSGADSHKPGLFELAHQGTIFLDEIGELDPKMQVKLLRVLDGVPYYRLGGVKKVAVDVRVVAATNQDLETRGGGGPFPQRSVSPAEPDHAARFRRCARGRKTLLRWRGIFWRSTIRNCVFPTRRWNLLATHAWPGNIRELRNVVTKAAVLAQGDVIVAKTVAIGSAPGASGRNGHGAAMNGSPRTAPASTSLDGMERRMILEALRGHRRPSAEGRGAAGNLPPDVEPEAEDVRIGRGKRSGMSARPKETGGNRRRHGWRNVGSSGARLGQPYACDSTIPASGKLKAG